MNRSWDERTLARVRLREPQALEEFFDAYFQPVYGYVRMMTRNPDLADDLVQSAFLRLHQNLDNLDPNRDPSPWVFTVVVNVVRDHWRSRAFRDSLKSVDLEELWNRPAADHAHDAGEVLDRRKSEAALRAALDRLSPADREILWLREFENLSVTEAARILDLSAEAARQRHSRAVKRLGAAYRATQQPDGVERR